MSKVQGSHTLKLEKPGCIKGSLLTQGGKDAGTTD